MNNPAPKPDANPESSKALPKIPEWADEITPKEFGIAVLYPRRRKQFPTWCQGVAEALGGRLIEDSEPNSHWRCIALAGDHRVISVHLNDYEGRVKISGHWPKDHTGRQVFPRECLRGDLSNDSSIHVSATRSVQAAAADIKRRFLPAFEAQWLGLLEVVASRKDRAESIEANSRRIANVLGVPHKNENGRDESYERTLWPGPSISSLYTVKVRDDSVKFDITLPVDEAEQVLELVKQLQAARKD